MRAALSVVIAASLAAALQARDDRAAAIVERARAYLDRYRDELSTTIAEEHYVQEVEPQPVNLGVKMTRVLESDYLLLRGPDVPSGWLGFRDVLSVDRRPVTDRQGRLEELLRTAGPDLRARAYAIAHESARFNLGLLIRTINLPTMALEFLSRANAARVRTKLASAQTKDGATIGAVEFEETSTPTIIRGTNGRNVRARGTWWIEESSGRITKTELRTTGEVPSTIVVTFGPDERLALWVPREMTEWYSTGKAHVTGKANYGNYRRFETSVRVIK